MSQEPSQPCRAGKSAGKRVRSGAPRGARRQGHAGYFVVPELVPVAVPLGGMLPVPVV